MATLLRRSSSVLRLAPPHSRGLARAPKPDLYRPVTVILADGSTYRAQSAVMLPTPLLQLERDPSNHPTYLATEDGSDLIDKRQASKIERAEEKARQQEQLFADEELGDDDLDNLY